jgi:hypothetical protein
MLLKLIEFIENICQRKGENTINEKPCEYQDAL